ncbi:MAG: hypothetical protein C4581_05075 [Nitrospiraceae bacterium]|nr:MAG: hypothetical protein C4581_05075 [Nitrospiraceae bacterium]
MHRDSLILSTIISVILLPLLILLSPSESFSEHTKGKTYLTGIIRPNVKLQNIVDGFKAGMELYGFREGENISYIQTNDISDIDSVVEKMIEMKVDLIFTMTADTTRKTLKKLAGRPVPVIFGGIYDPIASGIVKSLSVPGDNVTGVMIGGSTEKAFEWLLKAVPHAKKIYVPFSSESDTVAICMSVLKKSAEKSRVELMTSKTDTLHELTVALASIPGKADAIFIPNSPFLITNLETIIKFAAEHKLPTGSGTGQYKNGIMITYGQDHFYTGKIASRLASSVLHDRIPAASLPVETTEYFLGINLQTATTVGITVPDSILQQASFIVR